MNFQTIENLGETQLIKIIEDLIFEKTGRNLIRDDSFFLDSEEKQLLVLNSDMLVSTTDIPKQMSFYQIGHKSVIMNLSDIIVKGVKPKAIIISLGLPNDMKLTEFKEVINGILEASVKFKLEYIGGDLNETKELIISPTVLGWQHKSKIIYRNGMNPGDILLINRKFGLTGVGFDILINKVGEIANYPSYSRSISSVLDPNLTETAYTLANHQLATASIDSSDGLAKSLKDLMISNPKMGFEIDFDYNLYDDEAVDYAQENNIPLEDLVFNAGEEFIHLFTIKPKNLHSVQDILKEKGKEIFKIGRVINEERVFLLNKGEKIELKSQGFEHFK